MPIGIYEKDDIDAIAESIRSELNSTDKYTPKEMPTAIQNVSIKAYEKGKAEGGDVESAFEAGKQEAYAEVESINAELVQTLYGTDTGGKSYYDEFWDNLQDYGKRKYYRFVYAYTAFTYIDPKYRSQVDNADSIFTASRVLAGVNWDKFDLSATSSLYCAFSYCEALERIDTELGLAASYTTASLLNSVFRACSKLIYVKKITSFPQAAWKQAFDECYELVDITFAGVIGQSGLDLHWSTKLSKASITSVINALSTTTSGLSITLSKTAVNNGFTTDEWTTLIGTRSNWTVNLV